LKAEDVVFTKAALAQFVESQVAGE